MQKLRFQGIGPLSLSPPTNKREIRSKVHWTFTLLSMVLSDLPTESAGSEIPHSRSTRPLYSTAQLNAYFSRINLPPALLSSPLLTDPALARTSIHGLPFCLRLCGITWLLSRTKTWRFTTRLIAT